MTAPSDDMLMALADNELHGPEAEALRARIAADPVLAARYAVFAETRAALAAAFAPGPTPDRLTQAILAAAPADTAKDSNVVAFRPRSWVAPAPMAVAASLLLAVGVGGFLAGRGAAPQAVASPGVAAATALATLATGAETTLEGGATARVLGSYETDQGLCRLIDLAHPDTTAERAVVCRQGGAADWAVIASVTAGQAEVYIPASDTAAALTDQVLDDLGAGPALGADAEKAALAAGNP